MGQVPRGAAGLNDSGQSSAMISNREDVGTAGIDHVEDLGHDRSLPDLYTRDSCRHSLVA
jgi:hypothetical protein